MKRFEYRPIGQLVELGSDFAVNEVMGVRFTGHRCDLLAPGLPGAPEQPAEQGAHRRRLASRSLPETRRHPDPGTSER